MASGIFFPRLANHHTSRPEPPQTALQVIGCGLPRTGTTSLGQALAILLRGPVVDGGKIAWMGSAAQQRLLLELIRRSPVRTIVDRTFVLHCLAQLTDGSIAATDTPFCYLVEELLQLYPAAKFLCTVRDKETWWESYKNLRWRIDDLIRFSWLSPTLWRFIAISYGVVSNVVPQAVGLPEDKMWPWDDNHRALHDVHENYLRRMVPANQLFFVDIRGGWKPLCDILQLPIPDAEFPHQNSRRIMNPGHTEVVRRLKTRAIFLVLLGCSCGGLLVYSHYKTG